MVGAQLQPARPPRLYKLYIPSVWEEEDYPHPSDHRSRRRFVVPHRPVPGFLRVPSVCVCVSIPRWSSSSGDTPNALDRLAA